MIDALPCALLDPANDVGERFVGVERRIARRGQRDAVARLELRERSVEAQPANVTVTGVSCGNGVTFLGFLGLVLALATVRRARPSGLRSR